MAELSLPALSFEISADGRSAIFEIDRVRDTANGTAGEVRRIYEDASGAAADAAKNAAGQVERSAKAAGESTESAAKKAGDGVTDAANKSSKALDETLKKVGDVGKTMTASLTLPIAALYTAAIKGASDLKETVGKTEVVFGDMTDSVMKWSENSIRAMGMAQGTALEMTSTFGDMATGMGFSQSAAAEMSMGLTQLTADMASFKNISIDRTSSALTAVYTGETESLKSMGIVMTQTNLQAFALSQGIQKNISEMSQAEQVTLRYQYVMAMTSNAQGDFVRTGDSLANQSRKLKESVKQLGESFGKIMTPLTTQAVSGLQSAAQWVAELDDGSKRMVLTIGGVVAAAGPLLIVGAKMIKTITTIKAAMTALSLNPIALGITAAVAAGGLLYSALDRTEKKIDTTSAAYQRLKGIIAQKQNIDVDTSDLDDLDGKHVLISIDADAKAAYTTAQNVLDTLRSDRYKGTLTIDGDAGKAEAALNALRSAVRGMLSGTGSVAQLQAAISACEKLVISPELNEGKRAEVESILARLKSSLSNLKSVSITFSAHEAEDSDTEAFESFVDKVNELGWTSRTYMATGKFEVDETALSNAEEYKQALVDAAAATSDYESAVESLNVLLDSQVAEKVTEINAQAAEKIDYQARLLNSGIIDQDQYDANVETIIRGATEATDALRGQYEITKKLNEQYNNGEKQDDYTVTGQQFLALSGGAGVNEADYQSAVAILTEAKQAGADMTQYQTEAMIVNQHLTDSAIANFAAMTDAQRQYEAAMAEANEKQENAVTSNRQIAEGARQMQEALDIYADGVGRMDMDAESAIEHAADQLATSAEEYESIKQELTQALTNQQTGELMTSDYGDVYESYVTMQQEAEQAVTDAMTQGAADRKTALDNFSSDMAGLTGEFSAAETQILMEMTASTGAAISEADAQTVAAVGTMIENASGKLAEGNEEVADSVSQMIGAVRNSAGSANSDGQYVGAQITSGIVAGLNSGSGALNAAMRSIVNKAIASAKSAAKIQSPSKRMRDEVGVMISRGVAVGVEQETPSVMDKVRGSMNRIVSGAAQVVNAGTYTSSALPIQPTQGFDYGRIRETMFDAVDGIDMGFYVSGKKIASVTREETARQQNVRAKEISMGKGRIN